MLDDTTCLPKVLASIPAHQRAETPVFLGGTAGMRVLNATDATAADMILGNLSAALDTGTPFDHSVQTAEILSGTTEGILGWVTSNYLSNVFGTEDANNSVPASPLGALDWGGASSQITFEIASAKRRGARFTNLKECY